MNKFMPTNPTIQMICDYIKNNQMTFDNPVQRGLVWNKTMKSLLVHSVLIEYPVQPIYTNKSEIVYDVIDGKQRCTTFYEFINNEFALTNIPFVQLKDDKIININGYKYEQLPKELQSRILTHTVILYYADNLTQDEVQEVYNRLNNGKALSSVEKIKAKTLDIEEVNKLTEHPLFDYIITKAGRRSSSDHSYIQQSYTILFTNTYCLKKDNVTQVMASSKITDDQFDLMTKLFDSYYCVLQSLNKNKKAFNFLKKKIHFVSLIEVMNFALENNIDYQLIANWICLFVSQEVGRTTTSDIYNKYTKEATNEFTSVKSRVKIALEDFKEFVKSKENIQLSI